MRHPNRLRMLACLIWGHEWNESGSTRTEEGYLLHEYRKCDVCGLESHDRSGYVRELDRRAAAVTDAAHSAARKILHG